MKGFEEFLSKYINLKRLILLIFLGLLVHELVNIHFCYNQGPIATAKYIRDHNGMKEIYIFVNSNGLPTYSMLQRNIAMHQIQNPYDEPISGKADNKMLQEP